MKQAAPEAAPNRRMVQCKISNRSAAFLTRFVLILGSVFAVGLAETEKPESALPATPAFYHPDPNHLANRLHAALFVRIGPDENPYGQDRLEPLLWSESQSLLKGEQADRAVKTLEEFLAGQGDSLIDDPLKRAVLQRDLWLIASWLAERPDGDSTKLFRLLARAIQRLALTKDQIESLPDNYAKAVQSKKFATVFDPENPRRAYLPPDLFEVQGPWICVGRTDGRTAPGHLSGAHNLLVPGTRNPFTNSVFFVFLKRPSGRDAGLSFLKTLAAERKPIFIPIQDEEGRTTIAPNRDLPVLPIGSELALVRRAMLIDTKGQVVASPLTESVQLRVTTSELVPQMDSGDPQEDPKRAAAFEFELRRADLLADDAVGLKHVSDEQDFITGAFGSTMDQFEVNQSGTAKQPGGRTPFHAPDVKRRETCFGCHGVSTFYGTRSFQRAWYFDEKLTDESPPMYPVAAMPMKSVEKTAIEWKETDRGWLKLQALLRKSR